MSRMVPILAGLVVAATRVASLPRSFWQGDEVRFAKALLTFDPFHRQPDAPGYPLFIGVGRLVNVVVGEPFVTLVVISVLATFAGAILLARLAGTTAAFILYLSPPLLVFTPLPNPEALTLALIVTTLFCLERERPELFAATAAATIGCDPRLAPAMLVVFAIGWVTLPRRFRSLAIFAFVLLVCFVPLFDAIGRDRLPEYFQRSVDEFRLTSERAPLPRFGVLVVAAGMSAVSLITLFAIWRRPRVFTAMAAFGLTYLATWLVAGDLADRTQPLIPLLLPLSIAAAALFVRAPRIGLAVAVLLGVASSVYVWPLLSVRRSEPSPPIAAVRAARGTGAILLADPSLEAHASLSSLRVGSIREFDDLAEGPVVLLVDGPSQSPGAQTFTWPDSHAYGVITSERYRVASLVPLPPSRRYRARAGVYPLEGEWRWLAREAVIEIPDVGGSMVTLRFRLPAKGPLQSNRITVGVQTVRVERGKTVEVTVPAAPRLTIRAETSVTPPGDRRDLAVQLVSVER